MLGALLLTVSLQFIIIYNPFFNEIFITQPLNGPELVLTLAVSSIVFWAVEVEKWWKRNSK
jgi:Ca2+-transporting ATPase